MFIDKAKIFVTAGRGGDGCISFRREQFVPLGGPDGGNGGKGGDIYIETDNKKITLLDLSYRFKLSAGNGEKGQGSDKYGIWLFEGKRGKNQRLSWTGKQGLHCQLSGSSGIGNDKQTCASYNYCTLFDCTWKARTEFACRFG